MGRGGARAHGGALGKSGGNERCEGGTEPGPAQLHHRGWIPESSTAPRSTHRMRAGRERHLSSGLGDWVDRDRNPDGQRAWENRFSPCRRRAQGRRGLRVRRVLTEAAGSAERRSARPRLDVQIWESQGESALGGGGWVVRGGRRETKNEVGERHRAEAAGEAGWSGGRWGRRGAIRRMWGRGDLRRRKSGTVMRRFQWGRGRVGPAARGTAL